MQSLRRTAATTGNLITSPPTIRKRSVTARVHFPLNCKVDRARCILQPAGRLCICISACVCSIRILAVFLFIDGYFENMLFLLFLSAALCSLLAKTFLLYTKYYYSFYDLLIARPLAALRLYLNPEALSLLVVSGIKMIYTELFLRYCFNGNAFLLLC